jgi:D-3-phosphoglycerate dehydrogenase
VKFRILNAEPFGYSQAARDALARMGDLLEEPLRQEELACRLADVDVLIVRLGLRVTAEVLASAPRLKVVVTATTGLDHIDCRAAQLRGVEVLSLRGEYRFLETITATAEHSWALLLALMRRIPWAFSSVCAGAWDRDAHRGRDLAGRRLGILGLGRVGRQVARFGLAFGMQVAAHDLRGESWPEGVARAGSLEELLASADCLMVHVPLDDTTVGMIDAKRLALLPDRAVLVNTARGGVVDERALLDELRSGRLAGAALDVLVSERDAGARSRDLLLPYARTHENLIITPHLGGATWDAMHRTEEFMAGKLGDFLARLEPLASGAPSRESA